MSAHAKKLLLALSLVGGLALSAHAACPDAAAVAAYLAEFVAQQPSKGFGKEIDLADAACARGKLLQALPDVLGRPVGYKALFTNAAAQKRFGVKEPAWGGMFAKLMLPSGARLSANFGARPRYESDFIVVVKDAGLAEAQTPLEALKHIEALIPFVELPDLMLEGTPTGAELIATNAAFRGGVLGPRIAVAPEPSLLDALANMDVVITEERSGKEIGRAKGNVLMGQPIEAALWLARRLKADGVTLQPGDYLSLGGFLGSAPTQAGTRIAVRYEGLPDNPTVRVSFD